MTLFSVSTKRVDGPSVGIELSLKDHHGIERGFPVNLGEFGVRELEAELFAIHDVNDDDEG